MTDPGPRPAHDIRLDLVDLAGVAEACIHDADEVVLRVGSTAHADAGGCCLPALKRSGRAVGRGPRGGGLIWVGKRVRW